ncbi:GxxExxY protein [Mariprofundus ferrooxydans]|nr:GxxExxY protein [Mariprofundus ferrooxydans]
MEFDDLSNRVIGAALEVHKNLGAGLLESAYEAALAYELKERKISFKQQASLPVQYKSIVLDCAYRIDLLVENALIVELKAVEKVLPIHQAQLMTYMKLSDVKTGLLINFNTKLLKNGIKRVVL